DPDAMRICALVTPVVGATKTEAEDKMALIEQLPLEIDQLSLLAEALNFDFATKQMDEPLTDDELASVSGLQTIRDRVIALSGKTNPTVRVHRFQPSRTPGRCNRWRTCRGCGSARGDVFRTGVRWLRRRGDACARCVC